MLEQALNSKSPTQRHNAMKGMFSMQFNFMVIFTTKPQNQNQARNRSSYQIQKTLYDKKIAQK